MATACLSLHKLSNTLITNNNLLSQRRMRRTSYCPMTCRATSRSSSSSSCSITEFDLYDLLGIDSSSNQSRIKLAYRTLQKKCHPDIAGQPGHDMAIILNEAYSVLSNPTSRMAYDKEQAKIAELRGYTGRPMYSAWHGSEGENRAVFVDEIKCVGCLKCALFAERTFAIESVYGRARVIAQWADPEHKIQEAIETCPVNCISVVERSDLPALEFLMSKQPRGNVRVGAGNTGGVRVSNIFADVKKFQNRYVDAMDKGAKESSKEKDSQREAWISSIQAIRAISNWLYWQSNSGGSQSSEYLIHIAQKASEPDIDKLRAAAAARKQARKNARPTYQKPSNFIQDEYWAPTLHALPASSPGNVGFTEAVKPSYAKQEKESIDTDDENYKMQVTKHRNPIFGMVVPAGAATLAAVMIRLQVGERPVAELNEHIGGTMALEIVNSPWLQVILSGFTWYFVGVAIVELVDGIRNR
ncbi:hypothetical protein HS088_TW13G00829 [Tripterygium wilfordii]|uniref:J domain-containing protein n=1 Tax=Tripterygium wilfordii TaxID=458696 RepID=A0A7J7CVK6_TRIWF|nr:chaperone protein dnaJ C76, chloroplastic [Tripterygium wilfordii]KAF5737936.1 hypothetical protein HS088_TW13G00829 [Tripterygium wilfordii]